MPRQQIDERTPLIESSQVLPLINWKEIKKHSKNILASFKYPTYNMFCAYVKTLLWISATATAKKFHYRIVPENTLKLRGAELLSNLINPAVNDYLIRDENLQETANANTSEKLISDASKQWINSVMTVLWLTNIFFDMWQTYYCYEDPDQSTYQILTGPYSIWFTAASVCDVISCSLEWWRVKESKMLNNTWAKWLITPIKTLANWGGPGFASWAWGKVTYKFWMKPEKDLNNLMELLFSSIPAASGAYLAVANDIIWPTIKFSINAYYYNVSQQPQSIENCAINNSDDNTDGLITVTVHTEPETSYEDNEININIESTDSQLNSETSSYLSQLIFESIMECSDSSDEEKAKSCPNIPTSGQHKINSRREATKRKLHKLAKEKDNLKSRSLESLYMSSNSLPAYPAYRTKSLSGGASLEIIYFSDNEELKR
ncbi:hypothetical protein [Spiroplasma eriocheiris]|uniref:Uncharacterized protein n=1 Tax=Spiroplasma eriocheiris TaxID=315358 RepID=A0A0H3XMI3_9MOLU|nr:hypothetical protein [Spiroplasma eriocheiris]AHF57700.1 hypothetical protein SPE_0572 [Spiroplasma eriocheiris CCTCC M 207170]AKM54152.1 hypothetical protein SERIO_v1c05810 [Spiroplasma eriocheiris]